MNINSAMGNKNSEIQAVAEKVRMEFEQKRIPKETLSMLYSEYNPDVDGNIFTTEAEKIFPRLNCGLTSIYLKKMLGGEVIRGKYDGHDHTFLLLNNQVIDTTADQYRGPRVYVGELKLPWTTK